MTQLDDITEIADLNIKDIGDITNSIRKRNWAWIETLVQTRYKAPSLSAYLLYEYQINHKSTSYLHRKLGIGHTLVSQMLKYFGVPLRTNSEAQKLIPKFQKGKTYIEIYGAEIAKEFKMKLARASPLYGKTFVEVYGEEEADKIKGNLSTNNCRYWKGKKFSEKHRTNISLGKRCLT